MKVKVGDKVYVTKYEKWGGKCEIKFTSKETIREIANEKYYFQDKEGFRGNRFLFQHINNFLFYNRDSPADYFDDAKYIMTKYKWQMKLALFIEEYFKDLIFKIQYYLFLEQKK